VLEPVGPLPAAELASSTQGGVLLPGGTKMVPVTTGITGGTEVEIASGVNVGDQVVTQTVAGGASGGSTAASAGGTSALRSLGAGAGGFGGLGGAGGGAVRIGGGGAAGAARGG
ncbi:MAG TPA: hypothetical protein VMT81_01875, partial [Candidatus Paceibacterota bacterium]|nr:hypothetical protein [Candidatus Paceibacterota bacterium]